MTLSAYLSTHPNVTVRRVSVVLGMPVREVVIEARRLGYAVGWTSGDATISAPANYVAAVERLFAGAAVVALSDVVARLGCEPWTARRALRLNGYVTRRGRGARWVRAAA